MITDPAVFAEDHLPRQLRHRDAEADHLSRALQPAVDGGRAEDVLITGPSGVEKTVLSRVALAHLAEAAPIDTVHLRCLDLTEGDMLQGVLKGLGADASSWMLTALRSDLEAAIDRSTIVILVEDDGLPDTGMIHHLPESRSSRWSRSVTTHRSDDPAWTPPTGIASRRTHDPSRALRRRRARGHPPSVCRPGPRARHRRSRPT